MKKAFYILSAFYILTVALQLFISLYINSFHFAYPLDDTYIHLALSKNLTNFGVWGVTAFEFSSSSSSLLFTLIITLFNFIIPLGVYIPLLINLFAGVFLLYVLMKISINEQFNIKTYYLLSITSIFLLPLIALTISGMEHILHISFALILVYYFSCLIQKTKISLKEYIFIVATASISLSLRYETLFLLFAIGIILLIKKRFKDILIITILPLIPIVIFGLISLHKGSYFLPNTLLLKGHSPELNIISLLKLSIVWFERALKYPHILFSLILLIVLIFSIDKRKRNLSNKNFIFIIITLIAIIMQLTFARIGWFYRYESYLIALVIISFFMFIVDLAQVSSKIIYNHKKISIALLIIIISPFLARTGLSFYKSSLAPKNIYEQQVQMAKFIHKYYQNKTIVLNDIGAVCYYNKIKIIDVNGLANIDITKAIRKNSYNTSFLDSLSKEKKASIAILYKSVTKFKLPDNWIKVEKWKINNNVTCWKDEVFFYAIGKKNIQILKRQLHTFDIELPKDVTTKSF